MTERSRVIVEVDEPMGPGVEFELNIGGIGSTARRGRVRGPWLGLDRGHLVDTDDGLGRAVPVLIALPASTFVGCRIEVRCGQRSPPSSAGNDGPPVEYLPVRSQPRIHSSPSAGPPDDLTRSLPAWECDGIRLCPCRAADEVDGGPTTLSLTQRELESRLWAAANSLRDPVDPAVGRLQSDIFPCCS
jgi:hypothetical protein